MVQQRCALPKTPTTSWAAVRLVFMNLLMPGKGFSAVERALADRAGKRTCP